MRDAVNVDEAGPRDDLLDFRAAEARRQIAQQGDLALGPGGEVRMPPFGGRRNEPAVHVVQQRIAESGSGGDQAMLPSRIGSPRCSVCSSASSSTGTAYAIASRSLSSAHAAPGRRRSPRCAPRRARARWSAPRHRRRPGPATPKHARSIAAAIDRLRPRGTPRSSTADRGSRASANTRSVQTARTRTRRIEQAEPRLGAADVASEDHSDIRDRYRISFSFILMYRFPSLVSPERRPFALTLA